MATQARFAVFVQPLALATSNRLSVGGAMSAPFARTPEFVFFGKLAVSEGAMTDDWYYTKHGQQMGPMPFHQMASELQELEYWRREYVWRPGFDTWVRASSIPELSVSPPTFPKRRPVPYILPATPASNRWSILKILIGTGIFAALLAALGFFVRRLVQYWSY